LNKEGSKIDDCFDHWSVVTPKHIPELGNLGPVGGRREWTVCTAGMLSAHDTRFALLVFYGKHVMSSAGRFIDWMCGNYCCFWCVVKVMRALSSQIIPGPLVS